MNTKDTKDITFIGYSDDIVSLTMSLEGARGFLIEESYKTSFLVSNDKHSARVLAHYDDNGCWSFSLHLMDEGVPFPSDWQVKYEAGHDYSVVLILTVPDDVRVREDAGDDDRVLMR